jgi:uncharacterized protein
VLTADLVRARARSGRLELLGLRGAARGRALELAERLLAQTHTSVGGCSEDLGENWAQVAPEARDRKLSAGLCKLIEDACKFEQDAEIDAVGLRRSVFLAAARARRVVAGGERFDREAVLAEVAAAATLTAEQVERGLFSDLRGQRRLLEAPQWSPEQLIEHYEKAQLQAVLLRAVRIDAEVRCGSAADYRRLFHQLKFRCLLFEALRVETGYRLRIDGPHSLFEAVTKYGLQMALVLPALLDVEALTLEADLRWGKTRTPLRFTLPTQSAPKAGQPAPIPILREEVETLRRAFETGRSGWRVALADEVLEAPNGGVLVPDLVFENASGVRVYLEVLGYWNRQAVWNRVDWVKAGLPYRIVFALSSRLRVSEEALEEGLGAALYVFKGTPSARALQERLDLAAQTAP